MSITIELPPELEKKLRAQTPNLEAEAKAAYAIDLFRRGRLMHAELSRVLELDRCEVNVLLKRHDCFERSLTATDIDSDRQALERVLGRGR